MRAQFSRTFRQSVARTLSVVSPRAAADWLERAFMTPQPYRTPLHEREWMKAAETERVSFDAQTMIPVYHWGRRNAHQPRVLLVHGLSGRGSQLGHFIAPLLQAGVHVVAFDAPAHGDADGEQAALPEVAQAVERVAAHVGPLAGCIAHSVGAASTTLALVRGLECDRVVLIAPPQEPSLYLSRLGGWLGFTPRVIERTQRNLEKRFQQQFDEVATPVLATRLSQPVLILHDQQDRVVPVTAGRALLAAWPEARMIETEGLGHSRILRDANVVATAAEFLTGVGAAAHHADVWQGERAA